MNPNTYYNCQNELHIYSRERLWSALDRATKERQDAMTNLSLYREELRSKLIALLGLKSADLKNVSLPGVETIDVVEDRGLLIEKLLLTPADGQYIPALVYKLKNQTKAAPAVLFLCGHDHKGKAADEYQIACRILAREGFVVLTIDPPGQGERLAFPNGAPKGEDPRWFTPGTTEHTLQGLPAFFRGVSSAGYFMSEALAALAYLAGRPDVRSDQLAVSGNSGGGFQSTLLASICPDVGAVAPGTFISSRRSIFDSAVPQDAEQCIPASEGRAWDHSDFLLLISPRPCLVLAAEDDFFPITGCKRTVRESAVFWKDQAGKGLELFVDEGGHRYSENMAVKSAEFFSAVFRKETRVDKERERALPVELINCSESGQIILDRPEQDTWIKFEQRARESLSGRVNYPDESPDSSAKWLRDAVFNGRDARMELDFVCHHKEEIELEGIESPISLRYLLWESSEGLHNYGLYLKKSTDTGVDRRAGCLFESDRPLLYKLTESPDHPDAPDVRQALSQDWQVFIHIPTAAGPIAPPALGGRDPDGLFGARNKLTMDLISAGDSLAAIRIYDCITLLSFISEQIKTSGKSTKIILSADSLYGLYLKLAKRLGAAGEPDEMLRKVIDIDEFLPPGQYRPDIVPQILLPGILKRIPAEI